MDPQELFAFIHERVRKTEVDHPLRIAVDGVDGAGKTILADALGAFLASKDVNIIRTSIDGFHNPRTIRYREGADSPDGYYYDSFDHNAILRHLLIPLGPGGSRKYSGVIFDHVKDAPVITQIRTADPDSVLIFDGVFLQRPELVDHWDLRIFLDVPFDIILDRVKKRSSDLENIGDESTIEERYRARYIPGQRIYLEKAKPLERADIVIDNSDYYDPVVKES